MGRQLDLPVLIKLLNEIIQLEGLLSNAADTEELKKETTDISISSHTKSQAFC